MLVYRHVIRVTGSNVSGWIEFNVQCMIHETSDEYTLNTWNINNVGVVTAISNWYSWRFIVLQGLNCMVCLTLHQALTLACLFLTIIVAYLICGVTKRMSNRRGQETNTTRRKVLISTHFSRKSPSMLESQCIDEFKPIHESYMDDTIAMSLRFKLALKVTEHRSTREGRASDGLCCFDENNLQPTKCLVPSWRRNLFQTIFSIRWLSYTSNGILCRSITFGRDNKNFTVVACLWRDNCGFVAEWRRTFSSSCSILSWCFVDSGYC